LIGPGIYELRWYQIHIGKMGQWADAFQKGLPAAVSLLGALMSQEFQHVRSTPSLSASGSPTLDH
jgi:hypothetical protein